MIVAAHALTETTKEANAYALNHIIPTTNDSGIVERWLLAFAHACNGSLHYGFVVLCFIPWTF